MAKAQRNPTAQGIYRGISPIPTLSHACDLLPHHHMIHNSDDREQRISVNDLGPRLDLITKPLKKIKIKHDRALPEQIRRQRFGICNCGRTGGCPCIFKYI